MRLVPIMGRRLRVLRIALWHASWLNLQMLLEKIRGRKTLVICINAATQFMHIEFVLSELMRRASSRKLSIFILTKEAETHNVKEKIEGLTESVSVRPETASRFLLFCDFLLSVDQGSVFPYLGCKTRACCFHGQPSKGNVFQRFSYAQINTLFFYGPLMRDNYLRHKKNNPHWPDIECHEVGQPLSDSLINRRVDRMTACRQLGLDRSRTTVVYAPSFEYCSSFATHGPQIIETLLALEINLIVKPHPAFYNTARFSDEYNQKIPNIGEWREMIDAYGSRSNCIFSMDNNSLDTATALSAADVMLTDYSGIAFDGILLDLGMIYWDCPLLYSEYLPGRYGVDGNEAKNDLACNVGRGAGIVVEDTGELIIAVDAYRENPEYMRWEREQICEQLLFNPGRATEVMTDKIEEILGDHVQ